MLMTWHSKVYGIVQGVGFRPFVDRLAARFAIHGSVCNKGPYVEIFAQGSQDQLQAFFTALEQEPPERASILKVDTKPITSEKIYKKFTIIESAKERGDIFVSPDIATCDKCREELFDPNNRRYLHPFINCTACGPRLTILDSMPYDRERTSMGEFPMCDACHEEYTNPASRRYDAQPVCCNDCGPEVYLIGKENIRGAKAITATRQVLADGGIVAIKGIGGFHLACDAKNEQAVARLRQLKHRPQKPFAVMMRDFATVMRECELEAGEKTMLTGHQKPILLLKRKKNSTLAPSVAPGNPKIGVMLPYAPVQMLLFDYPDGINVSDTLIMTSGNPSGAPICRDDHDAISALQGFCDLMLSHNRKIRIRADDTVMDWLDGEPYMIRRSRGFAPLPVMVSWAKEKTGAVLGIGGELKNAFCVGRGNLFYPSPYVGDLSDLRTVNALKETIHRLTTLLETEPQIVACDLHPRYNSVTVAKNLGLPVFPVQHHYAHILSCMAENDVSEPVIGISFDGTGYGTDGTIWGGEVLKADYAGFERLGHIQPFQQAGGDKASTEGWRIALAMLQQKTQDEEKTSALAQTLHLCTNEQQKAIFFMLKHNVNVIQSTSAGRLFDAVSAMLGIRTQSTFEGEASMALEFAAEKWLNEQQENIHLEEEHFVFADEKKIILPTNQLFNYLLNLRLQHQPVEKIAYLFHEMLANLIVQACQKARQQTQLNIVALSGGVFQNHLLISLVEKKLQAQEFRVLRHKLIPPNDGGIGLGQTAAAMWQLQHKTERT